MTNCAHIDFETYSEIDIRKVGAHRYARHPSTEVLICCYTLPGMPIPAVWLPRDCDPPEDLMLWLERGGRVGAHNANFERLVWQHALKRQHPGIATIDKKQWLCTAAMAAASGLPRSLDKALHAAGCEAKKNSDGMRLIRIFSKPRKPTKKDPRKRITPAEDPEDAEKLYAAAAACTPMDAMERLDVEMAKAELEE